MNDLLTCYCNGREGCPGTKHASGDSHSSSEEGSRAHYPVAEINHEMEGARTGKEMGGNQELRLSAQGCCFIRGARDQGSRSQGSPAWEPLSTEECGHTPDLLHGAEVTPIQVFIILCSKNALII